MLNVGSEERLALGGRRDRRLPVIPEPLVRAGRLPLVSRQPAQTAYCLLRDRTDDR
jgi:hypothetical protein